MRIPRIFLCHASEDKQSVSAIHAELKRLGFEPWLDKVDLLPGQQWREEIPKAIRSSDFVLIFLSHYSVSKRGYVQKEFKMSLDVLDEIPAGRVFVIPIKLDDCDVPEKLSHLQCVALYEDGSLDKIVQTIRYYSSETNDGRSALVSANEPVEAAIQRTKMGVMQLEQKLLEVPESFRANYELLLHEANTGLIRLLPRGQYEGAMLVRGAGAYYSFSRLTHEYGYGSDIELQQKRLSVGFAGLDYGFFLPLGDVPLQRLVAATSEPPEWLPRDVHTAWRHVWTYQAPEQTKDIRREQRAYQCGVTYGSITLNSRTPADFHTTYLLRSINIGKSDLLVAIRSEEFLQDASLVLAWHRLQVFPITTPKGPDLYQGD